MGYIWRIQKGGGYVYVLVLPHGPWCLCLGDTLPIFGRCFHHLPYILCWRVLISDFSIQSVCTFKVFSLAQKQEIIPHLGMNSWCGIYLKILAVWYKMWTYNEKNSEMLSEEGNVTTNLKLIARNTWIFVSVLCHLSLTSIGLCTVAWD